MRADLRRDTDEIWVIDCSPEGHQPPVASRVFQAVQQPVCIVLAVRLSDCDPDVPARVRFRSLPEGRARTSSRRFLPSRSTATDGPIARVIGAPLPAGATGEWGTFPALDDFFVYNGSGVMPGRTWVIAPDRESLGRRWERLIRRSQSRREGSTYFTPICGAGNRATSHKQDSQR